MARYVISPAGRQDLHDIWAGIANDNLDAAERPLDRFEAAFERLAEFPGMGPARYHRSAGPLLDVGQLFDYLPCGGFANRDRPGLACLPKHRRST